jgi:hypothetical protein
VKAQENFERAVTEANAQIVAGYSDRMKLTDKERADIYSTNHGAAYYDWFESMRGSHFFREWGIEFMGIVGREPQKNSSGVGCFPITDKSSAGRASSFPTSLSHGMTLPITDSPEPIP